MDITQLIKIAESDSTFQELQNIYNQYEPWSAYRLVRDAFFKQEQELSKYPTQVLLNYLYYSLILDTILTKIRDAWYKNQKFMNWKKTDRSVQQKYTFELEGPYLLSGVDAKGMGFNKGIYIANFEYDLTYTNLLDNKETKTKAYINIYKRALNQLTSQAISSNSYDFGFILAGAEYKLTDGLVIEEDFDTMQKFTIKNFKDFATDLAHGARP